MTYWYSTICRMREKIFCRIIFHKELSRTLLKLYLVYRVPINFVKCAFSVLQSFDLLIMHSLKCATKHKNCENCINYWFIRFLVNKLPISESLVSHVCSCISICSYFCIISINYVWPDMGWKWISKYQTATQNISDL